MKTLVLAALLLAGCSLPDVIEPGVLSPIVIVPASADRPSWARVGIRVYSWSEWQAHCAAALDPACARKP